MAYSNTSRYLSVANGHIDSLIDYVLDVKPYHTKLSEIVEEFLFEDQIAVRITEQQSTLTTLGPDFLNKSLLGSRAVWDIIGNARPAEWLSANRIVVSDGSRRVFPVPTTVTAKLFSDLSSENFEVDVDDDTQIPGITRGVYNPVRWDGPGIARVLKNDVPQAESVDYHISHGAFSFDTFSSSRWKQTNIVDITDFGYNPGVLAYSNVYKPYGSIIDIESDTYEEWTLVYNADDEVLSVTGSESGYIGDAEFDVVFNTGGLTFKFAEAFGEDPGTDPFVSDGDEFILTPRSKITVSPTAPEETWTLIKTNPQALTAAPIFSREGDAPETAPVLSVYTRSLERTPASSWTITFTAEDEYELNGQISSEEVLEGYPKTVSYVDGKSFSDEFISFTLIPPSGGFLEGDSFSFSVAAEKPNYLVYGSESGWQDSATIGEWYWNGFIGFKIPPLEYYALKRSASISTSTDGITWDAVVVNNQELSSVSYINNAFIATGSGSIVAQSATGSSWNTDTTNFVSVDNKLILIGAAGFIAQTEDGETWYRLASHTTENLNGIDVVPTDTADEASTPNLIVVVGDNGTILTSLNGIGWTVRSSGVTTDLKSIAHNDDWMVAVGENGTILRSNDRINWVLDSSVTSETLNKIKLLNDALWAVGENGTILKSLNGTSWTTLVSNTTGELNDIAYGNGRYVAVGRTGSTCTSVDGVVWTEHVGRALNAIEFGDEGGDGLFVTVERQVSQITNFEALLPVHSVADPSVYSVVFRQPVSGMDVVGGTVKNNIYGYRQGLKVGEDWSDEFASFKITSGSGDYHPGEQVDVYLVPKSRFIARGNYDELPYESTFYDTSIGEIEYPLDLLQEYFPLYHSYGSVIFPGITGDDAGQSIVIDKASHDYVNFRIGMGDGTETPPPGCLAATSSGWVPLEYRFTDSESLSNISCTYDKASFIEAYLASDPDTKVFTIVQPKDAYGRPSSATLTFEEDFFEEFLPERRTFSFRFGQAGSYGQVIRVKMSENLKIFGRVELIFGDITTISISDSLPISFETGAFLYQADTIEVVFSEGGLTSEDLGYDILPYDTIGFDLPAVLTSVSGMIEDPVGSGNYVYTGDSDDIVTLGELTDDPMIHVDETSTEETGTEFNDGLQILVRHISDGLTVELGINYNDDYDTAAGGVLIEDDAPLYLVTHNLSVELPTVTIDPDIGSSFEVTPTALYSATTGGLYCFTCEVPDGTAPFRMILSVSA